MPKRWSRRVNANDKQSLRLRGLCWLLGIVLVVTAACLAAYKIDELHGANQQVRGNLEERLTDAKTITYQGKEYQYNRKLMTVLFMGVDRSFNKNANSIGARNGGQADYLMLLIVDPENKVIRRLPIDRDTMAEVTVLGVLGNNVGTRVMQICLSHGYGDGREQSCEFTVEAVERLLLGIPVDFYVAMDLDGIAALNDAIGGVTVRIADDFSAYDAAMIPGATVTLTGTQAELYVRSRMNIGAGTNEARMVRQQIYLNEVLDRAAQRIKEDANFVGRLFDALDPYLMTDMSRGRMINEAYAALDYSNIDTPLAIEGGHLIGDDGFMEFHADDEKLLKLVFDSFYLPG